MTVFAFFSRSDKWTSFFIFVWRLKMALNLISNKIGHNIRTGWIFHGIWLSVVLCMASNLVALVTALHLLVMKFKEKLHLIAILHFLWKYFWLVKQFAALTAIISNLSPWHLKIEGHQRIVSTFDFCSQDKDHQNLGISKRKLSRLIYFLYNWDHDQRKFG